MKSYSDSGLTALAVLKRSGLIAIAVLLAPPIHAWEYTSTQNETTHSAQLRLGADVQKKWKNGVALKLEEDLRFNLGGTTSLETVSGTTTSAYPAAFNKSYTTLTLSYKPVQWPYIKLDAGYTLKLTNKDTLADNKIMRHRVFMSVTGTYTYDRWSFSLRERVMSEIRMGELDQHLATGYYEHNRADWYLRSRLEIAYHAVSKPVKPYIWGEIENTLNANPLQQYYANNNTANQGQQFSHRIRAEAGVTWKLNRANSLNFYYRFHYGYDRDVKVKKNKQTIHLTEERDYQHAIGIVYHFHVVD